jgi:hypothetical protein
MIASGSNSHEISALGRLGLTDPVVFVVVVAAPANDGVVGLKTQAVIPSGGNSYEVIAGG